MDPKFLVGFVKQCMARGMSDVQTEHMFRLYASNSLFSNPHIHKGAASVLDNYEGSLTKAAIAKMMQPSIIADIVEGVIHEGKSAGAIALRMHHPVHQQLRARFEELYESATPQQKSAAFLTNLDNPTTRHMYDNFSQLPFSQKLLLVSALGGAVGGAKNFISPRVADFYSSPMERAVGGAVRGAAVGTGALLGGATGDAVGGVVNTNHSFFGPPQDHRLAQLAGAGLGAYAVNRAITHA